MLGKRPPDCNKGDNGKGLLFAGSEGFYGAAVMSATDELVRSSTLSEVSLEMPLSEVSEEWESERYSSFFSSENESRFFTEDSAMA